MDSALVVDRRALRENRRLAEISADGETERAWIRAATEFAVAFLGNPLVQVLMAEVGREWLGHNGYYDREGVWHTFLDTSSPIYGTIGATIAAEGVVSAVGQAAATTNQLLSVGKLISGK